VTKRFDVALDELSDDIKAMANDLRYNSGLDILYTGLLMDKYVDIKARKYGQNRSRLDIMHTLIAHGGTLKPSDLGKMTFRTKQTITKVIDGLERDGLVARESSGTDRRTRRVVITKKGLDSIRESLPSTIETINDAMPQLSKGQMEVIGAIMRQIRKHLLSQIESAAADSSDDGD
jgi:DNA-binding MarR family transcriptional regulator